MEPKRPQDESVSSTSDELVGREPARRDRRGWLIGGLALVVFALAELALWQPAPSVAKAGLVGAIVAALADGLSLTVIRLVGRSRGRPIDRTRERIVLTVATVLALTATQNYPAGPGSGGGARLFDDIVAPFVAWPAYAPSGAGFAVAAPGSFTEATRSASIQSRALDVHIATLETTRGDYGVSWMDLPIGMAYDLQAGARAAANGQNGTIVTEGPAEVDGRPGYEVVASLKAKCGAAGGDCLLTFRNVETGQRVFSIFGGTSSPPGDVGRFLDSFRFIR